MHKAFFEKLHKQWKHAKFNFNKGSVTLIKLGAFNRIMWLSWLSVSYGDILRAQMVCFVFIFPQSVMHLKYFFLLLLLLI